MLWCGRLQPPVLRLWVLNLLDAGTQQLILQQCGVGQAVFAIVRGGVLGFAVLAGGLLIFIDPVEVHAPVGPGPRGDEAVTMLAG